jgi:uncharacterized SAM-binding protein YcdF (DUF218 family)
MRNAAAALLVLALVLVAWRLRVEQVAIALEPISAWTEDHKGDCAVVLTGGAGRVREGFDLLAQGQVRKLIISGVHAHSTLRDIFPQLPFYGDLRPEDVILERRSTTTYGNAVQSLPLVEALRCRRVVLITSHVHMRRSLKTFRAVFPADVLLSTRSISSGAVPARSSDVFVEALKSIFYSLWAY